MRIKVKKPIHLTVYLALLIICICWPGFFAKAVLAHTPHDPTDVLTLSPSYGRDDNTIFIAISDQLLKSEDGGYSWKQLANGLDNSHLISSVCISPYYIEDKTLFFSTKGDGIYRSEDGGNSWAKDNKGLGEYNIKTIKISPLGAVVAIDIEGKLWRKDKQDHNWKRISENYSGIRSMCFSAISPEKSVMFLGDKKGIIYISFDEGAGIQQKYALPGSGPITAIAASPRYYLDNTLFVGTIEKGIFKSVDGGSSFVESNNGITEKTIIDLAVSSRDNDSVSIYVTTWHQAVFSSVDGAQTWQLFSENLTTDKQADTKKYRSPHFRGVRLSKRFTADNTLFVAGFDGLFVSKTGGKEWKQLETLPLSLVKGLDVFSTEEITSIAVTTYGGGAYISSDKGKNWIIGNSGLKTTRLSDIRFSPAYRRDKTILSASKGYLLISDDGGKSWRKTDLKYNGLRKKVSAFLNTIMIKLKIRFSWNDLLLKDLEKTRPWPTVIAMSQNYEEDKTLFFSTRAHGVYRSTDGGKTHKKVWDAAGRTIPALVISPDYSSDKTLFISVRGLGVFKSTDGGDSWTKSSNGFEFIAEWRKSEIVHQIEKKDVKLTISPDFKQDRTLFGRSSEGLYKSTDAGDTWQKIESPIFAEGDNIIGANISPDYKNDKTMIISVKGRGLYRTNDGGRSFSILSRELIAQHYNIEYLKFSPLFRLDNTIIAASDEAVFLSTDSGYHWKLLRRPVRYENNREDVIRHRGTWAMEYGEEFSANSISVSDAPGSSVELDFVGTGIRWIGTESGRRGKAKIFIDGVMQPYIEQFNRDTHDPTDVFSVSGLPTGAHQIRIEVGQNKDTVSTEKVSIDAFDVIP